MRISYRPILLLAVALAGCTKSDPLFCDESTPCDDPERPFCDLEGEYAESEGIKRTCIADPDFSIALADEDAQVRIGSELQLEVTVDRKASFPADVTITASGLPPGTSAEPITIDADSTSGTLAIQGGDAEPGALMEGTVVATSGPLERTADLRFLVLGPAGSLDPTFGTLGVAAEPSAITDDAVGLGQFSDGSLAVCGATFDSDIGAVIGFTADGDVNVGFGDDGVRKIDLAEMGLEGRLPYRCAEQSDGKLVVVVGTDSGELVVVRFTSDGVPDPAFAAGGIVVSVVTSIAVGVGSIAIGPNDEIVVGRKRSK